MLAPDQNTRLAMLKSGEADMVAITPDQVPAVQGDDLEVFTIPDTVFSQVYFFDSYNPDKITNLEDFGVPVAERVPLTPHPNDHNLAYLQTKRDRMGHDLPHLSQGEAR